MPHMPRGPLTLEAMREVIKQSPFNASLGITLHVLENGFAELEIPIRPDLKQFHGYVHGAIVGCAADNACAWAAASVVGEVVTSEYKVNLIAPAVGQSLIGRGWVMKASRRQVVCRSEVYARQDGEEKLVAAAMATIAVLG